MKRIVKITGWTLLSLILLFVGYAIYVYQTDYFIKAIIENDESELFYRPSKEMQAMEGLDYIEHRLEVADSISIYSYTFKARTTPKANIFLIRGNSGNITYYANSIQPLIANRFNIYSLDWRGYGKSNGIPNYKGVLKDTQVAFADFLAKTEGDSLQTIVYGMSLGGQIATKITKDNQEKVDALVLDGTLASAHSFVADNLRGFLESKLLKDASEFNQDYISVRDIADIRDVPKLIIHSKIDRAVPIERGKNVFEAAQEPKTFWETNTAHIKTLEELTEETIAKIDELLLKSR